RIVHGRRGETCAKVYLAAARSDRETAHGTYVNACIALDAQVGGKVRLDIAVQAALYLVSRLFCIEAHLDLDAQFLESLFQVHVNHLGAWHGVEVVAVPPCERAQLRVREVHSP